MTLAHDEKAKAAAIVYTHTGMTGALGQALQNACPTWVRLFASIVQKVVPVAQQLPLILVLR